MIAGSHRKLVAVLGLFSLLLFSSIPVKQSLAEGETCYDASSSCLVDDAWWDDDTLHVRWENTCSERVYAKMCNEYEDGDWDCGEEGIPGGSSTTWYTYNASGEYGAIWTGSLRTQDDWVCTSRISDWYDWP